MHGLVRPARWLAAAALAAGLCLCACSAAPVTRLAPGVAAPVDEDRDDAGAGGAPVAVQVLMWLPNRVLDALEMVRFGVAVGPGIGVDLRLTEFAQASAMSGMGAGVGWQGRWASPVLVDTWSFVAAGPVTLGTTGVDPVLTWPRTFWEVRASAHAALVFAEVAVDLAEIYDFVTGIFFFDPLRDDILGPHWI